MKSRYSIALLCGALAVCAACISQTAYGAPPTDACSLLTQAQVSAALGVNVGPSQHLVGPKMCVWPSPGHSGPKSKRASLELKDPRAFAYAKMPVGHGITKTPVSGVGDDAVSGGRPGLSPILTVKKGDVVFVVTVDGFPPDDAAAKEKTLALEVLAKL